MLIINESTDNIFVDKTSVKPKDSFEIDEDSNPEISITSYKNGSVKFVTKGDSIFLHCSGNLTAVEKDSDTEVSVIAIKELMSRRQYKRRRKYLV